MVGRVVEDRLIGCRKGLRENPRDWTVKIIVEAPDDIGGKSTRDFAGSMTTHPVSHQSEAAAAVGNVLVLRCNPRDRVFVGRPHQAGIGPHGADDLQRGRRLNHFYTVRYEVWRPARIGPRANRIVASFLRRGVALRLQQLAYV